MALLPSINKCSFPGCKKSINGIFCEKCLRMEYCSEECRQKHRKSHKKPCLKQRKTDIITKLNSWDVVDYNLYLEWNYISRDINNVLINFFDLILNAVKKIMKRSEKCDVIICISQNEQMIITNDRKRDENFFIQQHLDIKELDRANNICDRSKYVVILFYFYDTGKRFYRKLDLSKLFGIHKDYNKNLIDLDLDVYFKKYEEYKTVERIQFLKTVNNIEQLVFNNSVVTPTVKNVSNKTIFPVIIKEIPMEKDDETKTIHIEKINNENMINVCNFMENMSIYEMVEYKCIVSYNNNNEFINLFCVYVIAKDTHDNLFMEIELSLLQGEVVFPIGASTIINIISTRAKEKKCAVIRTKVKPSIRHLDFWRKHGFLLNTKFIGSNILLDNAISIYKIGVNDIAFLSSDIYRDLTSSKDVVHRDSLFEMYKKV